jgi:transposase
VGGLQHFAKGLRDDDDAIKAGVTLPRSRGPVEGQITRLKMLKRQMFGRASLALLERRFVLASGRVQAPSEAQVRPAAV